MPLISMLKHFEWPCCWNVLYFSLLCSCQLLSAQRGPHTSRPTKLWVLTQETIPCDAQVNAKLSSLFTTFWKRHPMIDELYEVLNICLKLSTSRTLESLKLRRTKSFLHPLTSWRSIPFSQTPVMWAVFLWGRREDYGTDGRQWKRPEGNKASVWRGHRKADLHDPELSTLLLNVAPPEVKTLTRHRWCSGLGRGTAPSASTEGQRTPCLQGSATGWRSCSVSGSAGQAGLALWEDPPPPPASQTPPPPETQSRGWGVIYGEWWTDALFHP